MAVHGTRRADSVSWDYEGLLQLLSSLARERSGLPVLRCYWYEATVDGRRTAEQDALADVPGIKLRVAKIRPGRREGVETEIHRDLTTLARNNAISDALVVSAEEDLAQVIADVQDLGMRVTLVHIAVDGNWTISRALRQESDDIIEISGDHLRPYVELVAGAEPVRQDEDGDLAAVRPLANGHSTAPAASYQQAPATSGNHAPPAIYTAPVVASGLNERPPWLATAFVPGPPLDQVVAENGPLPEQALWPLLAGLVEALQAIHACGVVHRDLKPANVWRAADGTVLLGDFLYTKSMAMALSQDNLPILRLLPGDARALVVGSFEPVSFSFGDTIVREGEPADAFYVLASGRARIVKNTDTGEEIPLSSLRAGDSFGEMGLLDHSTRTATVRASSDVHAWRLDKSVFEALLVQTPEIRQYLELQIRHRQLSNFFRHFTAFTRLPAPALALLLGDLENVTCDRGALVVRQGEAAGRLGAHSVGATPGRCRRHRRHR